MLSSYNDINHVAHKLVQPMWTEPIDIQEKVDGCLQGGVSIRMADGTAKRINLITEGEEVLGLDEHAKIVPTPVLKTWKNGRTEEWLRITGPRIGAGRGSSHFSIKCTPNHLFWSPMTNDYVAAGKLLLGDKVLLFRSEYSITPVQQSVILGKILGDGSINFADKDPGKSWSITWGHTEKDREYTLWTLKALGLLGSSNIDERTSGYGSKIIRAKTHRSHLIREAFKNYINDKGKKVISKDVITTLDPISLAVWYMDDGALNHHEDQEDRCNLSTNGFSYEEHLFLQGALEHLGIKSSICKTREYYELRMDSKDSERLFLLVAPYIIPCMQRKLPERYRGGPGWLPSGGENSFQRTLVPCSIDGIDPWVPKSTSGIKYDLTTGTHNFFANGILVHNSQISFGLNENDELLMRSKGQQLFENSPNAKMFNEAIASIKERSDLLLPGHIWRGEYLQKPKHNSLKYDRIPNGHIVIFDIEFSLGDYATAEQRKEYADFLGYETVPVLFQGVWDKGLESLKSFFETDSFLGGQKIEGIVAKCYTKFLNGKPIMAKMVSDKFKELHIKEWKKGNPNKSDIIDHLIESLRTNARWLKSIQHLRDNGELTNSPRDIGSLLKEICSDVEKEEEDMIKDALYRWAFPQISRGMTKGFVEFYKEYLLKEQ